MTTQPSAQKVPAAAMAAPAVARQQPPRLRVERERTQFRALILANPNYFGNLKVSPFKPVLNIQSNTTYEEIGCVGFQPQFNRLDAVVYVNQPSGYGGDVCSNGTPEYVRFYLSYDNGATWQDQGLASFTAYDIPEGTEGPKRLEYAVSLLINPSKKLCSIDNLLLARAILSWNVPPPPNDPGFTPVWGDVHDTRIQIDPLKLLILGDLLKEAKVALPKNLEAALDLTEPVPPAKPKLLAAAELQALYKDKSVEPHRFALLELQKLISQPALSPGLMAPGAKGVLSELNIDLADVIGNLFPTDPSTRYEEMECIGLNPNDDTLVGVIRVKLPSGYSGGPCTAGSKEFVTFWGDFDGNGTFETCLGTTSVNVYDIDPIPSEGLEYSVFLPVNLMAYRQPCKKGPRVVRIRAIMSWQAAPPCSDPNYVPVWGNRLETLVHIKPGPTVNPGSHTPFIETVGNMAVTSISNITGLANGPAVGAGFVAQDSPFGGTIVMTGHIAYPPDVLGGGAAPFKYKVYVSDNGGATWQPLANSFTIWLTQLINGVWSGPTPATQSVDADGWYEYKEDLSGGQMQFVSQNVLAQWFTGAPMTGMWRIKIEAKDSGGTVYPGSQVITVRLDNKAPDASIAITSGGGACADFNVGDTISGTYSVADQHFGSLGLSVQPAMGGVLTPSSRSYPTVPTLGESGAWSLNTAGMPRCGYVMYLTARDRTIVNSGSIGWYATAVVGFCLREAGE